MSFECEDEELVDIERLWVEELDDGTYRVDNVPVMCNWIAVDDVVEGALGADELLTFVRVVRRSGHSVMHVSSAQPVPKLVESLKALGCSFESAGVGHYAFDIPAAASWAQVQAVLVEAERRGCTVEEAYVSDVHAGSALGSTDGR
jgi:hypothetical protein